MLLINLKKPMSKTNPKKILIAAGGTGGHLFPAQALAQELLKKEKEIDVLFAGAGLSSNRNFIKERFSFEEVLSSTPYSKKGIFRSVLLIARGVRQSMKILDRYQPKLVVGFGSFHSFPLLLAALFKGIPLMIFESNSIPGKVNRLFSRWALVSAVQFSSSAAKLAGRTVEVSMPIWEKEPMQAMTPEDARTYYGLDPSLPTILVFGGSQGAQNINQVFSETVETLQEKIGPFQILHFTGDPKMAKTCKELYDKLGILSCVKPFEEKMPIAWKAATFAICRSGAATLAELIFFEVPAILIPYPYAADDHQRINAEFFEKKVGCAISLPDFGLNASKLAQAIEEIADPCQNRRETMHEAIRCFKNQENKQCLSSIVSSFINR
jgi:UDP-N-acetylglucosamine--N-acetylmuramyl-(pentapeptide) pyrophosphoryl-undecaprenol N-acetylglucosamine transferase